MKARARTALGIDLGARHVSLALVRKGPDGVRTLAAAGEDWSGQEQEQSPGPVLTRLLARLGRRTRIRGLKAALAWSADPLVVRLLELPAQVPANVGQLVAHELEQYVALSGKGMISDFSGVGVGTHKRLLVAAADAHDIQAAIQACGPSGIVVEAVEPAMLASARALSARRPRTGGAGAGMIALLGVRTLALSLFRRGTLEFVRMRALPAEANEPRRLGAWLAEELRAVVRYYETQVAPAGPDWQVDVVLHDARLRTDEITRSLADATGIGPFTVLNAWEPVTGGGAAPENAARPAASIVAVGAALSLLDAERERPRINLLPKAVTKARSLSRHLLLTANVCVVVFLGVFAAAGLLRRTTGAMDRRIEQSRLDSELYATPALIAEEKFLDQEIARLRQRLIPLHQAMKGRYPADWPGILHAVRQATPPEVALVQLLGGEGATLALRGHASSCPMVETFVRNLEGQSPFASASLGLVQTSPDASGPLEFRIDCVLRTPGGTSS
jgi:Tfp pilus assembly protein PilN